MDDYTFKNILFFLYTFFKHTKIINKMRINEFDYFDEIIIDSEGRNGFGHSVEIWEFFYQWQEICDDQCQNNIYTVWKNEKFALTEKIFREIDSLVTSFVNALLSRNFCSKSVRVNFSNFQTVSFGASGRSGFQLNLSDVFFSNFFRQNCHHKWLHQRTVWKLLKFTLPLFSQKFRESNVFTKVVAKELLSQNVFWVRVNFSTQIFREINFRNFWGP